MDVTPVGKGLQGGGDKVYLPDSTSGKVRPLAQNERKIGLMNRLVDFGSCTNDLLTGVYDEMVLG